VAAVAAFAGGVVVSLATSWVLVSRIERIGDRLGMSEALLGIVAALAADAPEITAAVTAVSGHQQNIGAGVVLGSNVFNLAALLGLGALVAGRLVLYRKVVALGGAVAMWVAVMCLAVVARVLPVAAGLGLAAAILAAYIILLGTEGQGMERLRLPQRWWTWLRSAVTEEEIELEDAIRPVRGRWPDAATAAAALLAVVASSIVMERAASSLGQRYGIPQIITGGLILAAVTSLPNAVAAVYLASRGRGAASLSTALNSNTINVIAGLLIPAVLLGLGRPAGQATLVTFWYAGMSLGVLALAYRHRGLGRAAGSIIIAAYAAFVICVVVTGYATAHASAVVAGLSIASAVVIGAGVASRRSGSRHTPPGSGGLPGPAPGRAGHYPAEAANDQRHTGGPSAIIGRAAAALDRESLIAGWPAGRLWALSITLSAAVGAADTATGPRIILIGLLIIGPCCAVLTLRWLLTALTGILAVSLAVALGIPDGIFATGSHMIFISSVAAVAASCTCAAAFTARIRQQP
jgi:cation:H+ antiporter